MQAYPEGLDCVWLAIDRNQNVGAFITAGMAPIPKAALGEIGLLLPDVEEALHGLPAVTSAEVLVLVKRPESFIALAERGVYVFDWCDIEQVAAKQTGQYEPVAVPTNPIRADSLSETLLQIAKQVQLNGVQFADRVGIRIWDHIVSVEPPTA